MLQGTVAHVHHNRVKLTRCYTRRVYWTARKRTKASMSSAGLSGLAWKWPITTMHLRTPIHKVKHLLML